MAKPNNIKNLITSIHGRKLTVLGMLILLFICARILGPGAENPPWENKAYWDLTLKELGNTFRYALIALSMAIPAGLFFGFFASTTWWPDGAKSHLTRTLLKPIYLLSRFLITLMRSIHELIWALFFLAALGHDPITACIALSLPFTGTLAKVFSEIIDEQNTAARDQMIISGARPLQAFLTTLIPQSFPDMATYTLYRFECALRSSAVLGFIGIETIGLSIKRSFENNFYNELWTELYLLMAAIMLIDILGARLRKCLNSTPERKHTAQIDPLNVTQTIQYLKKTAPRWKTTKLLFWVSVLLMLLSWFPKLANISTAPLSKDNGSMNRSERISLFVEKLIPQPVRDGNSWAEATPWAQQLWHEPGKEALINTTAMATTAVVISALCAWLFLPWANRSLANARPLNIFSGKVSRLRTALWQSLGLCTRGIFLITRAIPEYIYAYLLIGLLGISAWPLVIALALHNFGILGRLWGEVMENQSPTAARQLLQSGGSRFQSYLQSTMPEVFNRFLMYLFYRWETCVREATILGMLGFASLGLHINLARNFSRAYDEMFFYVVLGVIVIFIGDFISIFLRRGLRKTH